MATRLMQRMLTASGRSATDHRANSEMGEVFREVGVRETSEFSRVARIPRRNWEDLLEGGYGVALSRHLSRPGSTCQLLDVQAAALTEFHDYGGFLGALGLGAGKTLLSLLAATIVGAQRPVLLIPGGLRNKTINDTKRYRAEGWLIHPRLELISYEQVSRNPELLIGICPDVLICDEVSALKNVKAACTKRVSRLMKLHPATKFMGLSGTISTRSLLEFWHLLMWSTFGSRGELMPLPRNYPEVQEWALAVDEKVENHARMQPGALITVLGQGIQVPPDVVDYEVSLVHARMAVQRRLRATAAFMHTSQLSCDASISMEVVLDVPKSPPIERAIADLRAALAESGEDTKGELLLRPADVWAKARMLSQGFIYDWEPPPPDEWRARRRRWHKLIRWALANYGRVLDTPMQVAQAVDKNVLTTPVDMSPDPEHPDLRLPKDILADWRQIEPTYEYKLVPRWIDESRMDWVVKKYLTKPDNVIVWVEHTAVGHKLAELSGRPFHHHQGLDAQGRHIEKASGPIIASVKANHKGVNLQQYHKNFILSAEPTGSTWEQLIGRSHRQGQLEDHVYCWIFQACKEHVEGLTQVLRDAAYAFQTVGEPQRLLLADKINL